MTVAHIEGLGRFELDWHTTDFPTEDPGADPWIIEITTAWWLVESRLPETSFNGITVNHHALWHVMPDGRCLSEHLEQWVYDHEEPEEYDYDYDYDDGRDFTYPYEP